jgi:hypothetical protein
MATPFNLSIPISGGASAPAYSQVGETSISPVIITKNSFLFPLLLVAGLYIGMKLWNKVK